MAKLYEIGPKSPRWTPGPRRSTIGGSFQTGSVGEECRRPPESAESGYPVAQLPKIERIRVETLGIDEVVALADAVDDRYRALVVLAAGTGMRQVRCSGRRSLVRGLMTVSRPVGGEMARTNSRAGRSCRNAL